MLLVVANYKHEIPSSILTKQDENLKIEVLNENKWWNFAFKLQKLILKHKPTKVLHIWTAWGEDTTLVGKVFHIQRSFLRAVDSVIESQKHRFVDGIDLDVPKANIVTKLNKSAHTGKLYDFASIFDLETFRVGQLTNFFALPIISIKGITDTIVDLQSFEQEDEIDFLLNPEQKRTKKLKILKELENWLQKLYPKFENVFNFLQK